MNNDKCLNIAIIVQFYSGLKTILDHSHWSHSGSPAYYNFIKLVDRSVDIKYQLILLETVTGCKGVQKLYLDNLKYPIIILPYFSITLSSRIPLVKKIENFYNKIRQYYLVFIYTKKSNFYYVDRDNIIFSFVALYFKKTKVIIRLLGVTESLFMHLTSRNNPLSKIIKSVFNNSNVNFICSNDGSYAETVKIKYGSKFHLLFNGVNKDLQRNFKKSNKLRIVYLSRIVKDKGHEDFIYGVAKSKLINSLDIKIIGDGNLKNDMVDLTNNLALANCIDFIGLLNHSSALDELSKTDLVISMNHDGVFGNGVLEAAKMGIPLIVLKHPGSPSSSKYNLFELQRDENLLDNIGKTIDRAYTDKEWLLDLENKSKEFASYYLHDWSSRVNSELKIVRNFFL